MEDITSEITNQALSQISNNRVEQARQELERIENEPNTVPPNEFNGDFFPVGTSARLLETCILLMEDRISILEDSLRDVNNGVYVVRVLDGTHTNSYWVNEYWHSRLIEAASNTNETTNGETQLSSEDETLLSQALENEHQEIPVNSRTITIDETTSRFSGAIWYEKIQQQTVTLAGVGGIGRFGNLVNFSITAPLDSNIQSGEGELLEA